MSSLNTYFSIVIATHNRPRPLRVCLDSLVFQDFPQNQFEVIVVDDGSPTPLRQLLGDFDRRLPLRWIRTERAGCGPARNAGAREAKGRIIAFTDDDCSHPEDWLQSLSRAYARWPDAMVGGRAVNTLPSIYSATTQILVDFLLDWFNADRVNGRYLNSIAVPREGFFALNGFDPRLRMSAEDRDFCSRWRASGRRIVFLSDLPIYHAHQLAFSSYWRQHFNYGRGAYHLHCVTRDRQTEKDGVQPLSFYTGLLFSPFRKSPPPVALQQTALLGLAQVATFAGWMKEKLSP